MLPFNIILYHLDRGCRVFDNNINNNNNNNNCCDSRKNVNGDRSLRIYGQCIFFLLIFESFRREREKRNNNNNNNIQCNKLINIILQSYIIIYTYICSQLSQSQYLRRPVISFQQHPRDPISQTRPQSYVKMQIKAVEKNNIIYLIYGLASLTKCTRNDRLSVVIVPRI